MTKSKLAELNVRYTDSLFLEDAFNLCIEMVNEGIIPRGSYQYGDRPCIGCKYNIENGCAFENDTLDCVRKHSDMDVYTAIDAFIEFSEADTNYGTIELINIYRYLWSYEGGYDCDEYCPDDSSVDDFIDWAMQVSKHDLELNWDICIKLDWGLTKLHYIIDRIGCSLDEFKGALDEGFLINNSGFVFDEKIEINYVLEWSINHKWGLEQAKQKWDEVLKGIVEKNKID